jgi:hypothetical protein
MKGVKVEAKKIDEQLIVALFRRRKKSVLFRDFFPIRIRLFHYLFVNLENRFIPAPYLVSDLKFN